MKNSNPRVTHVSVGGLGEELGGFAAVAYESPPEDEDSEPASETRPEGDESIDWCFTVSIQNKVLVKELAQTLERQFAGYAESRAVGMVINTREWIEGLGYKRETLQHDVDVVKLQKSGGVVFRNPKVRQKSRSYRITDLSVYKIGGVPIGAEPAADPTRLVPVNINRDLLHLVLAVSFAKEPEQIISSNVAGFIYITDINIHRKKITYLAPSARQLPSRFLIMGTLTWLET
ncbi:unnamed protein product [Camellia sinensis]